MKTLFFKQLINRIYSIAFSLKNKPLKFELKQSERCMVLGAKLEDIFIGIGGTILKAPDSYSLYSLTNGFKEIQEDELSYEEKVDIRKKEFDEIIEKTNISYGEFVEDIDENKLILRYDRFKSIIISDFDYIFVPNILETSRDNKAIAILLNELLKERPYKKNMKLVMYEITSTLPATNAASDIEETTDKKMNLINSFRSPVANNFSTKIQALNQFRGAGIHRNYAEALCIMDIADFKKLCKIYSL